MPIPIAIDTDPGVDDAIALMLAMRSRELSVELLTTVAGNVPINVGTRNAKRIVALVDPVRWPIVSEGSAKPLSGPLRTAISVHNRDGLGGNASKFPVPRGLRVRSDAAGELIDFTRRHGSDGVIVALGPLTNIAKAIMRAPEAMARLGRLVIMGGAIRVPGNMSAVAEFNIFVDPEAAARVLAFGLDTLLVPLDVTRQVRLTGSRLAMMGRGKLAMAAKLITTDGASKLNGMPMHDAVAVAVAIDSSLIGTETLSVSVETVGERTRGMTVADLRESRATDESTISVATTVDAERTLALLDQRVFARRAADAARRGDVVVVGSANIDLSFAVDTLPVAGETVLGESMVQALGGKGANQAVAAYRAGANVSLIARFGEDEFGDEWLRFLAREGIDARECTRDAGARTGVATITSSRTGENQIAVASGANAQLKPDVLEPALHRIARADVLLTQLEIPLDTVKLALETARAHGVLSLHNPAPAQELSDAVLRLVDVLVCNEIEAQMLARQRVRSIPEARKAALLLRARGIESVVITLGAKGAVYIEQGSSRARHLSAQRVKTVDTTGAGDTFVGYLGAALAQGMGLERALELANTAAARSVTRRGAVPSIPTRASLRGAR